MQDGAPHIGDDPDDLAPDAPEPRTHTLRYLLGGGFHTLAWYAWGPRRSALPTVLCAHGLTRTGRDFDPLAAALARRGRRVLCPDLPGRGASGWLPDPSLYAPPGYVASLSDLFAREEGPLDWVGTSLGGVLGLMVAASAPGTIRRLVLNDIGVRIPGAALARIAAYVTAPPERFADLAALEQRLRTVHAPFGTLNDAAWRHLAVTSARPVAGGGYAMHYDPAIAEPLRAPQADIDLGTLWTRVRAPVLLLRGEHSDVLPRRTALAMTVRPGVRLIEWPGCGHAPALVDSAQVHAVAEFLAAP